MNFRCNFSLSSETIPTDFILNIKLYLGVEVGKTVDCMWPPIKFCVACSKLEKKNSCLCLNRGSLFQCHRNLCPIFQWLHTFCTCIWCCACAVIVDSRLHHNTISPTLWTIPYEKHKIEDECHAFNEEWIHKLFLRQF